MSGSQAFFSTVLIRRPCPLKMMVMRGCSPVGLKQICKVQKRLPLVVSSVWLSCPNSLLSVFFISGLDRTPWLFGEQRVVETGQHSAFDEEESFPTSCGNLYLWHRCGYSFTECRFSIRLR